MLTLPGSSEAIPLVEAQLRSWLKEKRESLPSVYRSADWDGPGLHKLGAGAELVVVHDSTQADIQRRRYHLTEVDGGRVWGVTISVLDVDGSGGRSDTVVVEGELEEVDTAEAIVAVSTPRVARYILSVVDATNGTTRLTSGPEVIQGNRIDDVLEAIRDGERSSAVIVAGSISAASDRDWTNVVAGLTGQSLGLASTFVVADSAIDQLNASLPPSHRVARGSVRTFAPSVDLDSAEDGIRHPVLTPNMLTESLRNGQVADALKRRHAQAIRTRALEHVLPRDVRRGLDRLARDEFELIRSAETEQRAASGPALTMTPSVAPSQDSSQPTPSGTLSGAVEAPAAAAAWPEQLVALTRTWLGRDDESDATIRQLHDYIKHQVSAREVALEELAEKAERESELEEQVADLQQRLDALELDATVDAERAREGERAAGVFAARLRERGGADLARLEPLSDEWAAPSSVADLVLRMAPGSTPISQRVVFTGNIDIASEIDVQDQVGRFAGYFWDYACVLFDYAEVKARQGFAAGVHSYLTSPNVHGRKCPPTRHLPTESAEVVVNAGWRAARELPVPRSVAASGHALMTSHFRPTRSDPSAPRLYYLDDVLHTGKLYIGYIGPQLPGPAA